MSEASLNPQLHEGVPLMRGHHLHHGAEHELQGCNDADASGRSPSSVGEGTAKKTTADETARGSAEGGLWAPLYRHISMQRYDSTCSDDDGDGGGRHGAGAAAPSFSAAAAKRWTLWWWARLRRSRLSGRPCVKLGILAGFAAATLFVLLLWRSTALRRADQPLPIERAREHLLDVGGGVKLWFRVWGDRQSGVPVLFVHGGPGNAIADYGLGNARFFDYRQFYVVEVDQRGTGQSQPSVRDGCHNFRYYEDISIQQMSGDFEAIRHYLGIERWLVFGGSWGSTLSLDYAERFPERVLGLIIRGIYLNTKQEFDAVYTRSAHLDYPQRLREFDRWFARAQAEVKRAGEPPLNPDDAERFFQVYRRLLLRCDKYAIWHWFVFENNLMETIPENLRDPEKIDREQYPEALSVSFFENFLFYRGTFVDPPNILERLDQLKTVPVWICQGLYDEVCPERYARELVQGLEDSGVTDVRPHFVESGHESSDPIMARCLVRRVDDFLDMLDGQ